MWQRDVKKSKKLIKIFNIEEENLHIFWTTWGASMTFSGNMWLMKTKKTGLHPVSEKYILGKTKESGKPF